MGTRQSGRERRERVGAPRPVARQGRDVHGAPALGEHRQRRRVLGQALEPRRHGAGQRREPAVLLAQVDGQRARLKRVAHVPLDQRRELASPGRGARALGQLLQDHARVVGPAEERAVDPLAHAPVDLRAAPQQHGAEDGAEGDAGRPGDVDERRERRREPQREGQRDGDAHQREEDREPALDQQVAGAPPEEHGISSTRCLTTA